MQQPVTGQTASGQPANSRAVIRNDLRVSATSHRLREIREQTGTSLRTIASKTGISIRKLREQERSDDISVGDLMRWRDALDVPTMELFRDSPDRIEEMVRIRAGLIQLMRSVRSIQQTELDEDQQAMAQNMESELQRLMPELDRVRAWPRNSHQARSAAEPARVESNMVMTELWCPEINNEF